MALWGSVEGPWRAMCTTGTAELRRRSRRPGSRLGSAYGYAEPPQAPTLPVYVPALV